MCHEEPTQEVLGAGEIGPPKHPPGPIFGLEKDPDIQNSPLRGYNAHRYAVKRERQRILCKGRARRLPQGGREAPPFFKKKGARSAPRLGNFFRRQANLLISRR